MGNGPKILLVVNVDWFFLSHRLPLAKAARDHGAEVTIAAADTGQSAAIHGEGFRFLPIALSRKGTNPAAELRTLWSLIKVYRGIRPDLVHHVTIKPVIYGSLAARLTGLKVIVNAISGLGYSFSADRDANVLRPFVKSLYRIALASRRSCTVFQNPDDRDDFIRMGLVPLSQTALIRGSGVDCARFRATQEPAGPPVVMLPGRLLWDKGVGVFVEAARLLRTTHPEARFVLVGAIDSDNRAAIPAAQIDAWTAEHVVEWWGHKADMVDVLQRAHIVTLPSTHREGLPKVLLEAAASARPIVATAVPGCREIVRHNVNGLLVPPGDAKTLALCLHELLQSRELREKLGRAGRQIAESEFSLEIVVQQTLSLYRKMLGGTWPPGGACVP